MDLGSMAGTGTDGALAASKVIRSRMLIKPKPLPNFTVSTSKPTPSSEISRWSSRLVLLILTCMLAAWLCLSAL